MKKIIVECILLLLAVGTIHAQYQMRIPLKQGNGNSVIETGGLVIVPVDLYIPPRPRTDSSGPLRLELKIITRNGRYETTLNHYTTNRDRYRDNYPLAIENFLFDLDIGKDSIYLSVDTLKPGDTFVFDKECKNGVTISGLTITYAAGYSANLIDPAGGYDGYEISHSFKLSKNGEEEIVTFSYAGMPAEEEAKMNVNKWKGYIIEVVGNPAALLQLKVTEE